MIPQKLEHKYTVSGSKGSMRSEPAAPFTEPIAAAPNLTQKNLDLSRRSHDGGARGAHANP